MSMKYLAKTLIKMLLNSSKVIQKFHLEFFMQKNWF